MHLLSWARMKRPPRSMDLRIRAIRPCCQNTTTPQKATMPGTEEIVKSAATEAGWVAAMFASLVIGGFTILGLIVRQLWTDHRELNVFVRDRLTASLAANTKAFARLTRLLGARPCLLQDTTALDQIDGSEDSDV